ncbi:cytochrome d ubiquinol oxidase subunit II [Salmonella enterica subsp. enterica]|nr:cytochrome d ubiquinol oxidase subunit II [Salmonella enterica subsp. enterica]
MWLITANGALFYCWPMVYAAAFSGFLCSDDHGAGVFCSSVRSVLITVPRLKTRAGATCGTGACSSGSFVPPLVIGVAFGELLQGVPAVPWMSICVVLPVTSSGC